jgi:hypothetical protein
MLGINRIINEFKKDRCIGKFGWVEGILEGGKDKQNCLFYQRIDR